MIEPPWKFIQCKTVWLGGKSIGVNVLHVLPKGRIRTTSDWTVNRTDLKRWAFVQFRHRRAHWHLLSRKQRGRSFYAFTSDCLHGIPTIYRDMVLMRYSGVSIASPLLLPFNLRHMRWIEMGGGVGAQLGERAFQCYHWGSNELDKCLGYLPMWVHHLNRWLKKDLNRLLWY